MLDVLLEAMKKSNQELFVMYNHENSDRYFCKYISNNLGTATLAFISKHRVYLIVNELDSDNAKKINFGNDNVSIYYYKNSYQLKDSVEEVIAKEKFPTKIALAYSTLGDSNADVLGHGEYVSLTKRIKETYKKYQKNVRFVSAEKIIYDIGSKKSSLQIKRMKLIGEITNRILEETFKRIKPFMSEIEISELTRETTEDITDFYINSNDIVDFDFAWDICPIVLTGVNLTKGGHSLPSVKKLKRGDTIYFDFGIKVFFKDKTILNSDIQRMGYVLKENETEPPKSVKKVFNALVSSIDAGMECMKPGVKAYKIDEIVRKEIAKYGYPDYNHATGHSVGEEVHDVGAVISTKNNKRANFALSENSIYTLEPRIAIVNGGSIEEMIQVTKFGGIPICKMQKKLYIVS